MTPFRGFFEVKFHVFLEHLLRTNVTSLGPEYIGMVKEDGSDMPIGGVLFADKPEALLFEKRNDQSCHVYLLTPGFVCCDPRSSGESGLSLSPG